MYSFFKKAENKRFNHTIGEILVFISNKILQELKIIKGENNVK
ncbi:hypothetical protein MYMA111404_00765 [Mycoplasma marinum]|nr:hypothetical protein [Mycoplasma marinum]